MPLFLYKDIMRKTRNKTQIISEALTYTNRPTLSESETNHYDNLYYMEKDSLAKQLPWLCMLRIIKELPVAVGATDLNYDYSYNIVGGNVETVIGININDNYPSPYTSLDGLLALGYTAVGGIIPINTSKFRFINNILYSGVAVKSALVQIDLKVENWTSELQNVLIYRIASQICRIEGAFRQANSLEKRSRTHYIKAQRQDALTRNDSDYDLIYNWLEKYYNYGGSSY